MQGVPRVTLEEICCLQNGRAFKKSEWRSSGKPIIRIQNLNNPDAPFNYFDGEYDSRIEVNSGDLLFSWSGTVGSSFGPHIWDRDSSVLNQHIFKVTLKDTVNRRYAYHALRSITAEIERNVSGAVGLVHITKSKLSKFEIPLPPPSEQGRIVSLLDEAFGAIGRATAHAEKNLANARELFEGILNNVFIQKGEGWVERTLGQISKRVSVGHVGPTSEFYCDESEGIPFLRSQNVRPRKLDLDGVRFITKDFHEKLKKSQLQAGDLLFVRVGANRGDCCSVTDGLGEMNCANIVFARPCEGHIAFLEHYCQSGLGREKLLGMTTGSAQGVINTKSVAELRIPLPSADQQLQLTKTLDNFLVETRRLESNYRQRLTSLAELKQSILQKAFSGELTALPEKTVDRIPAAVAVQ